MKAEITANNHKTRLLAASAHR